MILIVEEENCSRVLNECRRGSPVRQAVLSVVSIVIHTYISSFSRTVQLPIRWSRVADAAPDKKLLCNQCLVTAPLTPHLTPSPLICTYHSLIKNKCLRRFSNKFMRFFDDRKKALSCLIVACGKNLLPTRLLDKRRRHLYRMEECNVRTQRYFSFGRETEQKSQKRAQSFERERVP